MLVALSTVATEQTGPTQEEAVTYKNVGYLNETKAHSIAHWHQFLINHGPNPPQWSNTQHHINHQGRHVITVEREIQSGI